MNGTYDFIDQAAETLAEGGHQFVLLALNPSDAGGGFRFSIRAGVRSDDDIDKMRALLDSEVREHLESLRNGN